MIKNRTAQLIFQTAFCTLGIIGIMASLGFFDYAFRADFFVHFTNISNYFAQNNTFPLLWAIACRNTKLPMQIYEIKRSLMFVFFCLSVI